MVSLVIFTKTAKQPNFQSSIKIKVLLVNPSLKYLNRIALHSWWIIYKSSCIVHILHFSLSPDPTLTASQLCAVFENVEDGWGQSEYTGFPASLNLPYIVPYPGWLNDYPYKFSRPDHIKDSNPSPSDYWRYVFELFLGNHPAPSWKLVARAAYMCNIDSATELILHKYIRGASKSRLGTSELVKFSNKTPWSNSG